MFFELKLRKEMIGLSILCIIKCDNWLVQKTIVDEETIRTQYNDFSVAILILKEKNRGKSKLKCMTYFQTLQIYLFKNVINIQPTNLAYILYRGEFKQSFSIQTTHFPPMLTIFKWEREKKKTKKTTSGSIREIFKGLTSIYIFLYS